MEIVKNTQYYETVQKFCAKHSLYKVETSSLENNTYKKQYLCEDGSVGYEVNRIVYETTYVEVKGIKCKVLIKLLETEWFDTGNGKSIFMYEQY